jgi:hypothetical protein
MMPTVGLLVPALLFPQPALSSLPTFEYATNSILTQGDRDLRLWRRGRGNHTISTLPGEHCLLKRDCLPCWAVSVVRGMLKICPTDQVLCRFVQRLYLVPYAGLMDLPETDNPTQ